MLRAEYYHHRERSDFDPKLLTKSIVNEIFQLNMEIEIISLDSEQGPRLLSSTDITDDNFRNFFRLEFGNRRNHKYGREPTLTILFCTRSPVTVTQMKQDAVFTDFLQKNDIWIQQHLFTSTKWRAVGTFFYKHPDWILRQPFESALRERVLLTTRSHLRINSNDPNYEPSDEEVDKATPYFEVSVNKNWTRFLNKQKWVTDLLVVKCAITDVSTLSRLLASTKLDEREFGAYVPLDLSWSNERQYIEYMKSQIRFLQIAQKIAVVGLFPKVFNAITMSGISLRDEIMKQKTEKGKHVFRSIEHTHTSEKKGYYSFIVYEDEMASAMNYIDEKLPKLYEETMKTNAISSSDFPTDLKFPRRTNKEGLPLSIYKELPQIQNELKMTDEDAEALRAPKRNRPNIAKPPPVNAWTTPLQMQRPTTVLTPRTDTTVTSTITTDNNAIKEIQEQMKKQDEVIASLQQEQAKQKNTLSQNTQTLQDVQKKVEQQMNEVTTFMSSQTQWNKHSEITAELRYQENKASLEQHSSALGQILFLLQNGGAAVTPGHSQTAEPHRATEMDPRAP